MKALPIKDVTGSGKGRDGFCDNCGSESDTEKCNWCDGDFCALCVDPGRHAECTEVSMP